MPINRNKALVVSALNKGHKSNLTVGEIKVIRDICQRMPIRWYCTFRLKMEFHGNKAKCPGPNHLSRTRLDRKTEDEFVIFEDNNSWRCFGYKCKPWNYGDAFDLEHKLFFPKDKKLALDSLLNLFRIYKNMHRREIMSQSQTLYTGPKWKQTRANWGTKKNPAKAQARTITGDRKLLNSIIRKETEINKLEDIIALSPFAIASLSEAELAWRIHTSLFRPEEKRAIGKRHNEWEPLVCDEEELSLRLQDQKETLLDYTYMTTALYYYSSYQWLAAKKEKTARNQNNITDRVLICVESDSLAPVIQLKVIAHLAELLPLCVITHSGDESYHALFNCRNHSTDEWDEFTTIAKKLYADPRTLEPNAWCRLPNGKRWEDKEARQKVVYFDPDNC
jgi:hypothetical protein